MVILVHPKVQLVPRFGNNTLGIPRLPQYGAGGAADTYQHTVLITVPGSVTGNIIGRKGSVIRDIRTGSHVN